MSDFTILVDDREKKEYSFNRYPVDTKLTRLKTGDYAIADDGRSMGEDSFDPHFATERKNPEDFLQSITWERDRFEDELARADSMTQRMPIIIEKPWSYFEGEKYWKNVGLNSIIGTIETHPEIYNVEYFFSRDRTKGEQLAYEFLKLRNKKLSKRL